MQETPDITEKQESRRRMLRKVGRFVLPTLITFHLTTLKARASESFGMPNNPPAFNKR